MYKKLTHCKYCNICLTDMPTSNRANHSRWCLQNPKRAEYTAKNNGSQLQTDDSIAKRSVGIKKAHASGKYDGAIKLGLETKKLNGSLNHSIETKSILRQKALASPHRRLVRSIREYTQKDGTIVKLDSAWEEALAIRLDEINVNWIRPSPVKWTDKLGVVHNYFPDFYLIDFDIYLDPKNPYAIKAQQLKIDCLLDQIKNLRIIKSLEECKTFTPIV
jgi:hypothetical protein